MTTIYIPQFGGGPGAAGGNGGAGSGGTHGGYGGAGGNCTNGNANITWIASGTTYGTIG